MRHLQRHLQQTIVEHVRTNLAALGWVNDPINFGAEPVIFREVERQERVERIDPTTLSITLPVESRDRLAELGGPLYSADFDVVLDVYASAPSIATALASDLKALWRERTIPLLDFSASTPVEAGMVDLEDAVIVRPDARVNAVEFKGSWRIVRAFSRVWFEDQE